MGIYNDSSYIFRKNGVKEGDAKEMILWFQNSKNQGQAQSQSIDVFYSLLTAAVWFPHVFCRWRSDVGTEFLRQ